MKAIDVTKGKAKSLLSQAQQQIVDDGGSIFATSLDEAKQFWVDVSISVYEEQNFSRRKQRSESYLARHGSAVKPSAAASASESTSSYVCSRSIGNLESTNTMPGTAQQLSQQVLDSSVSQVSKLFTEQQCADALRDRSNRLLMPNISEKSESELKKDKQVSQLLCQELRALYQSDRYKRILASRETLPAFQHKEKIISEICKHRVTLVVGDTGPFSIVYHAIDVFVDFNRLGCGKTTQIPQV
jgi:hypothetical protein